MLFLSHGPLLSRKFQTYHKTLHDAEVVMDDLGQGRQAVSSARGIAVEEKEEGSSARGIYRGDMRPPHIFLSPYLTIFSDLSYFSWLTPITNMGASAEGAEMITRLAPPFR